MMRILIPRGFTLVEILVVIMIIAILASLLFPAFVKAQEKSRQATCLSNQHQINVAVSVWKDDHHDSYPPAGSVWNDIKISRRILTCPSKPRQVPVGYVYSSFIADKPESLVTEPTEEIVTADGTSTPRTLTEPADIDFRHNFGFLASYCDGHVEMHKELPPMWYVDIETMGEYNLMVQETRFPTLLFMYTNTPAAESGEYQCSQELQSRITKLAQRYRLQLRFVGCNGDNFPELEQTGKIQRLSQEAGYPTVILSSDGREVSRLSGYPKNWSAMKQSEWREYGDDYIKQLNRLIEELLVIK
jgi:prepilin-type N-terminal cleavage/methylation domain-containing protein/prepilin-type processing-associated H-X9-DG protein